MKIELGNIGKKRDLDFNEILVSIYFTCQYYGFGYNRAIILDEDYLDKEIAVWWELYILVLVISINIPKRYRN
jgi:hypothetical protein